MLYFIEEPVHTYIRDDFQHFNKLANVFLLLSECGVPQMTNTVQTDPWEAAGKAW